VWGGVYLIPNYPSYLRKLKAMEELFGKGGEKSLTIHA
jgi:hypothetical protein